MQALTRFNARLARYGMYFSVGGLSRSWRSWPSRFFGRYVMNDSPTWTENLALVLILYVTLVGAAVGVRDAGHIGMESLLVLVPEGRAGGSRWRSTSWSPSSGAAMAYNGWVLGASVAPYKLPNLGVSEAIRYVPLVVSGALIILFSIEHFVALIQGTEVEPAWH